MDTGSEVGGIVAATCLPDKYPPVRVRDSYSTKPVAVAKATSEVKINWATQTDGILPATDMVLFLFRNAARHFIYYDGNPSNLVYNYVWGTAADSATPTQFPLTHAGATSSLGVHDIDPGFATPTSAYAPHGPILFAGEAEGHKYMWMDGGGRYSFTWTKSGAANDNIVSISLYQYVDGRRKLIRTDANNTPGALPANSVSSFEFGPGYYNFQISHLEGSDILQSVSITSSNALYSSPPPPGGVGQPVWCHRPVNGFLTNLNKVQSYAITASALLWRNTASYQNAQGNFGATQCGKGVGWETVAAAGGYSAIAQEYSNQWNSRFAAKGEYAFIKPEDAEDFQMNDDVEQGQTSWSTCTFPLNERSGFLVFAASVAETAGRDTTVRLATHIQYETTDSWSDIRPPTSIRKDWEDAMSALTTMEQFYENPTHIREILASIGKYGRVAVDIASYLLSAYGGETYGKYGDTVKRLTPALETLASLKKKKKM